MRATLRQSGPDLTFGRMNDEDEPWSLRYELPERIDFDILGSTSRQLPFFSDDLFLGMQVMNVGIVDRLITEREYQLLAEYRELERNPFHFGHRGICFVADVDLWPL